MKNDNLHHAAHGVIWLPDNNHILSSVYNNRPPREKHIKDNIVNPFLFYSFKKAIAMDRTTIERQVALVHQQCKTHGERRYMIRFVAKDNPMDWLSLDKHMSMEVSKEHMPQRKMFVYETILYYKAKQSHTSKT